MNFRAIFQKNGKNFQKNGKIFQMEKKSSKKILKKFSITYWISLSSSRLHPANPPQFQHNWTAMEWLVVHLAQRPASILFRSEQHIPMALGFAIFVVLN